jgi:hypothetical protein
MGMTNYQKFKSKSTKDNLRVMWLKRESHYQSKEIANQAKVYNNFLGLRFKGTNMYQFIADLTGGQISNLCAVRTPFGMGWQSCEGEITEIIFQSMYELL